MSTIQQHILFSKIQGGILVFISLLWFVYAIDLLLRLNLSLIYYCFLYAEWIMYLELLFASTGIGLGVLVWKNKLPAKFGYLILAGLYAIIFVSVVYLDR